jgi:hypothetical protein
MTNKRYFAAKIPKQHKSQSARSGCLKVDCLAATAYQMPGFMQYVAWDIQMQASSIHPDPRFPNWFHTACSVELHAFPSRIAKRCRLTWTIAYRDREQSDVVRFWHAYTYRIKDMVPS